MMIPAQTSEKLTRVFTLLFVLVFFAYLFGPLIVMGMSAFNTSSFPRISPWDCFTVEWFEVLTNDTDLMTGLRNSVTIAVGVVIVAVPLGLAGALMLTQVSSRLRPWYYTIVISPILIPGVVLGISTLVFWDRMGRMFNAGYESFFYDGIFLTIVGQSTFVAAYAMLIFISRLQRFDSVQEEAALDLGATHVQTFRKILLPFLKPAVGSACVLGFLASFENYNTTIFTIVSKSTLTTVLASKVRYGINPSISALAVIIIALTLIGAIYFEIIKRREEKYERDIDKLVKTGSSDRASKASLLTNPAMLIATVIFIAGLGTVYFAGTIGVNECKASIAEQKAVETKRKVDEFKKKQMFKKAAPSPDTGTGTTPTPQSEIKAKGTEGYGSIFAPSNLEEQVDSDKKE
jgi:spermidine/putrescine transport system permease protein